MLTKLKITRSKAGIHAQTLRQVRAETGVQYQVWWQVQDQVWTQVHASAHEALQQEMD